ncbi:predicted protein [Nematostella vectensis]|uniref:Uncharacterized protein n=1 Tax=Nematostella vectensis TaxID=45351 RepID=A7S8J3_NEMVE|nr:uncharacterized protein LOC5511671 [Nematostella vectensis]EDO39997.1 predicted protein [Nematostella vectensis]|eukprot:XP_001632060.1 predicted protein [Nematostella vectensis]
MNLDLGSISKPLCYPLAYDPSFKVEVRLHEPLWKVQFSPDDVALELLTLCSQLEALCRREYSTSTGKVDSAHKVEYQSKFEPKAKVLIEKMREMLHFLPVPRPNIREYIRQTGLSMLFPKVTSYLNNPERPAFLNQKSAMDGYFHQFAMLNQMVTLCHQLNSDAFNLTNHKYIAHQVALLYQAVNQGGSSMADYKKAIEDNFKPLKASLHVTDKDAVPKLPQNQKEWISTITSSILDQVSSLPQCFTAPLMSTMVFVEQHRQ